MGLIKKLKNFFSKKKKLASPQNNMDTFVLQTPLSVLDNNDNFMPEPSYINFTGATLNVGGIFDTAPFIDEAAQYKAQRDERLKNFKTVAAKNKKTKEQTAAEEREREYIKEIIKIAKQPKSDGKTT